MRFRLLVILIFSVGYGHAQQRLDSLLQTPAAAVDSLKVPSNPLDSVQTSFYHGADSLKQSYRNRMASLDSSRNRVQSHIDSLNSLSLPTDKYTGKLDSINAKQASLAAELDQKIGGLKAKTVGKLEKLELPDETRSQLASVTKDINGFKLPVKDLNIPNANLPDSPLKSLDGLNTSIDSPIGKIGELGKVGDLGKIGGGNLPSIPGADGQLGDLSKITGQAGDLKGKIPGDIKNVNDIPQGLENKAGDLSGVGDIKKQADGIDPNLGKVNDLAKDPAAAKDQALQQVKQKAVDHFAGKEKQLQEAMDKMSKLKQKYSSLNSLSEIPKKRPNEMRGKPFIERLLPGIALQIQKGGDNLMVDFNPYAGYRMTGRLTTGLGWNQRVGYDTRDHNFSPEVRIFGPRVFGEYKLGKGFSPRLEAELMNTYVPPMVRIIWNEDHGRQWVPGVFVGMKKEFRISKGVRGTSMVMLRTFNSNHKSPYSDVLNVRFGFEFPMRKKSAKQKAESAKQKAEEKKLKEKEKE
jgi:hypothetical protein